MRCKVLTLYCIIFELLSAPFVLPLPAYLHPLPPPPTSSVPLATSIYCSIELLMFLILDEKRSRAAAPLIYAFELWVTLLPPHWLLQSQVITSWLITHRDTCPHTHTHTDGCFCYTLSLLQWELTVNLRSFAACVWSRHISQDPAV